MDSLSESFRALGDPTRLRILRLLSEAPLNVSELVSLVGVAQPSVSHHLAKLRQLELIREERQAAFTFYSLSIGEQDPRWPLVQLANAEPDTLGDRVRLAELLRQREDRQALNERLLEPGQSWFLWAGALSSLLPPMRVADFGCGTGVLSTAIAQWAKHVVAIDRNAEALAQAKERAAREKLKNLTFLREDLHQLSLADESMDLVVMSQSLHHVKTPERVLEEASRILKPGGKGVVLELMPHQEAWVKERLGHLHLGLDPGWVEEAMSAAGFRKIVRHSHRFDAPAKRSELPMAGNGFRVFLMTGVKK